ncbi:DeoR/GlpR family DNA-binding transcription regulator [Liquorilactobacillus sicerae]|uniref:DeoR/GlpR family DNA-binding transcription regulator n=1 Tax=Liquorilactobacillus sicerae TaxID=1416943 RepID=UPI00248134A2|nr:DeoR/GlpR family DNA-binding transcription regulator [Liquorilactobacillus sicerae]
MLKEERIKAMNTYITKNKTATMQELADNFHISANTLRRDLNELLKKGDKFKKIYGGVILNENYTNSLIDYRQREHTTSIDKIAIGKKAATLIENGDLIFFDSGTTTDAIAPFLPKNISFTLITNSLQLIEAASPLENIKIIVVGSQFNRKTRSFTGIDSKLFESYNLNKSFMSATGISLNNGVTNSEFNEFRIKSSIIKKSIANSNQQNFLLIDHTKFDKTALMTYAQIKNFYGIITNNTVPQKYSNYFKQNDIRVFIA